jgi:hypothetical protein
MTTAPSRNSTMGTCISATAITTSYGTSSETSDDGGSGVETLQEINLRGMRGGALLFTDFWSPGITLLCITMLTLNLSTFNEFRTHNRNAPSEGLQQIVTFAENVRLNYLSDNGRAPLSNTPPPACLKLNVTANEKRQTISRGNWPSKTLTEQRKGTSSLHPQTG